MGGEGGGPTHLEITYHGDETSMFTYHGNLRSKRTTHA